MTCISPIAPFGELAVSSPLLSILITARIHCVGTPKRRDASAMYDVHALEAVAEPFDVLLPADATNENVTKLSIRMAIR